LLKRTKATIRVKFNTERQLKALLSAIEPETNSPSTHRADVKLEKDDLFLVMLVEAEDTVSLRATLNTYLHWVNSTLNIINTVANS
jgi:KEOPS complex subunit Pcc1